MVISFIIFLFYLLLHKYQWFFLFRFPPIPGKFNRRKIRRLSLKQVSPQQPDDGSIKYQNIPKNTINIYVQHKSKCKQWKVDWMEGKHGEKGNGKRAI